MSNEKPGIAVIGPTASGKSRLALALAIQFRGEIVSCDAFQVYRHMDIGTAKVTPADQKQVRHHMIDIVDPDRDFSAGEYQRLARRAVRDIHERGFLPFVAGGTGFYLRALIEGLFEGPARVEELRIRMKNIIRRKGSAVLHRALKRVDPECAGRIAETDAERIIRAYEVYLVTGKPMCWWQEQPRNAFRGFRWLKIGINLPREQLYQRINQRVDEMFGCGLLDETRKLLDQFPRASQAFKAIGYRQAAAHLEGNLSLEEAIEETKKESRHYAKRQMTWFRSDRDIVWLDGQSDTSALLQRAVQLVTGFLS
ncbi:MAG: tRNA (adenosine(37)-N6)-dimethylallyltransferase MiaA [Acidobacteria bacterium]|nr:tRNA (adenosine(37)-N6)-dimethylallyltransferase MiaA [Acidobacteriota bacterium]